VPKTRQEVLKDISNIVQHGLEAEEAFVNTKHFWTALAVLCLEWEEMSTSSKQMLSNVKMTKYSKTVLLKLHGKRFHQIDTVPIFSFTLASIHNNLYCNDGGLFDWRADRPTRYTDKNLIGAAGGWSKEGIDKFFDIMHKAVTVAKKLKPAAGAANPKGRHDVWDFTEELEAAEKEAKKTAKKPKKPEEEQREKEAANQPLNQEFDAFF
jgi:hypothetical protein